MAGTGLNKSFRPHVRHPLGWDEDREVGCAEENHTLITAARGVRVLQHHTHPKRGREETWDERPHGHIPMCQTRCHSAAAAPVVPSRPCSGTILSLRLLLQEPLSQASPLGAAGGGTKIPLGNPERTQLHSPPARRHGTRAAEVLSRHQLPPEPQHRAPDPQPGSSEPGTDGAAPGRLRQGSGGRAAPTIVRRVRGREIAAIFGSCLIVFCSQLPTAPRFTVRISVEPGRRSALVADTGPSHAQAWLHRATVLSPVHAARLTKATAGIGNGPEPTWQRDKRRGQMKSNFSQEMRSSR